MIKDYTPEQLEEKGLDSARFCGHYSDQNFMIKKVGTDEMYSEAIDLLPCLHEYEETLIPIDNEKTD